MKKINTISELIKNMIFSGTFLAGERLPSERELAKKFSVSRPAIHEALLQLQGEGILTIRPRHGCVVKDLSKTQSIDLINDLYLNNYLKNSEKIEIGLVEFREMILEKVIKKLIQQTKNYSEKEKNDFFSQVENLIEFSIQDDLQKIAAEDFEFYSTLVELSDEEVLLFFFKMAKTIYIHHVSNFFKETKFDIKKIAKYKKDLLIKLKSGEEDNALEIMKILTHPKTYRHEKY